MADAAWKAVLRQRVAMAQEFVGRARQGLEHAREFIHPEVAAQGPDAPLTAHAVIVKYSYAIKALRSASHNLNAAAVHLEAARVLALHGGNLADPSVALPSVHLFGPEDSGVWAALERLHDSPTVLRSACASVEWSAAHLSIAMTTLAARAHIPNAIAIADREGATADVAIPMQFTQAVWDHVTAAREILAPY